MFEREGKCSYEGEPYSCKRRGLIEADIAEKASGRNAGSST
jgi:hypothetical protein